MSQDPRSPRVLGKKNTKTPTSSPSVKVATTTAKMRSDATLEGGGRSSTQTEGDGDNSQGKRNLTSPLAMAKVPGRNQLELWPPAGLSRAVSNGASSSAVNYLLDEEMLQKLIDAGSSATAPAARNGASSSAVYYYVDKGDDDGNTSVPGTQHVKSGALGLEFNATPAETAGGGGGGSGQRADTQRQPRSPPVVMATMHGKRGRDGSSSGTAQKMETSLAQQGHHELKTVGGSNAGNGRVPRRPSVQAKEEGEEDDMPPTDGGSVEGTLAVASTNSSRLKAQVSSSPSIMPPPGVKDEVAPSWKGKWSQYEQGGLGVTLPDRIRSMAVPRDVAVSLEALCVHYPWIVYLGYVFWRKLLVQFWLPDHETELARNSCWVFTNPSNLDAGLPSPVALRLGILGDLRAFSSEMLHPIVLEENASVGSPMSSKRRHSKNNHQIRLTTDHMKQNLSNSSFGQFLEGLMLADQIDLVRLLVDQLGLDLAESWAAWPRESGGANSGSVIELSLRAPRSRIPSMLLKMKRTPAIGLTLIHIAACNGQKAMVEFLYQQDPTLAKETDNSGWTPMHIAAIYGQRDVVEFLYQQDPTLAKEKDVDGETPLHIAARNDHKDVVEFLFQQGLSLP